LQHGAAVEAGFEQIGHGASLGRDKQKEASSHRAWLQEAAVRGWGRLCPGSGRIRPPLGDAAMQTCEGLNLLMQGLCQLGKVVFAIESRALGAMIQGAVA
jgi:hypothetical protein